MALGGVEWATIVFVFGSKKANTIVNKPHCLCPDPTKDSPAHARGVAD
jgi:hypothetical protein